MMFTILGGGFVAMLGLYFRYCREWRDVEPSHDGTADECWHFGVIYANPRDPSVLVERRIGFGYMLNFSRPGGMGHSGAGIGAVLVMAGP